MTEESENKQQVSTSSDATGWHPLSNELLRKIIARAADDPDAWTASETSTGAQRTSRHVCDFADSSPLRQYKDNLDGGRLASDAVIETAFTDENFSDRIRWDRRYIGKEAVASTPALEFPSPETRSEIFNNIYAKDVEKRMR
ncbi:hypothetical protein ACCS93_38545 [Rhizobium ruizarguesonis]